jgi:anti-sigma factor RsiW
MTDPNDAALTEALRRLPRRRASEAFKRSLEARFAPKPRRGRRMLLALSAAAGAAVLSVGLTVAWQQHTASQQLYTEAVNDHLRLLYAERPIEIESGGVHQVKPWFAGRLDFAPALGFGGDEEFPLQGGAVAYFLDRKAAAFEFKRRLHPITLFVFRADGLAWPTATLSLGTVRASVQTERGFHTLLWREADLGYALVSDLDEHELSRLGAKLASR